MPKLNEMLSADSKFLNRDDVGKGLLLTVASVTQMQVSKDEAEHERRWCLLFHENEKALVLRSTTLQQCAQVFSSDDSDHWIGKRLVLFVDPNVSYGGKLVGGIRVRKPKPTAPPAVVAPLPVVDVDEDTIPF